MIYNVKSNNSSINWSISGDERIIQNVVNILNTVHYEVAYDRVMGRSPDNLDQNFDSVKSLLIAETYDLIEEYEPRAKVKDILMSQSKTGELNIEVVIEID